jgi:hypothetical protein
VKRSYEGLRDLVQFGSWLNAADGDNVHREPISADQVKAMFDARPDFSLPLYEEASAHWGVQTPGPGWHGFLRGVETGLGVVVPTEEVPHGAPPGGLRHPDRS